MFNVGLFDFYIHSFTIPKIEHNLQDYKYKFIVNFSQEDLVEEIDSNIKFLVATDNFILEPHFW